jgi:hypothetical protein
MLSFKDDNGDNMSKDQEEANEKKGLVNHKIKGTLDQIVDDVALVTIDKAQKVGMILSNFEPSPPHSPSLVRD